VTAARPRRRLLLLGIAVALVAAFFALGLNRYLTLESLHRNDAALHGFVADHPLLSATAFFTVYALVVGLSVPGAAVMTVSGGLLFGLWTGSVLSIAGATAGAVVVLVVARLVVGDALRARAGSFLTRMAEGFKRDAFSYLLFLRLVPLFPFWAVNLVAAILGVRVPAFAAATVIGIIPSSLAYAAVGDSLGRYFEGGAQVPLEKVLTPEAVALRLALALLALLPIAIKWARRRRQQ